MGNPETVALATALEIELESVKRQLEALAKEDDAQLLENKVNSLIDHLPTVLVSLVAASYVTKTWESILATKFAEGVNQISTVRNMSGKLMRPEKAYELVRLSGALNQAANPLEETKKAIEVRAEALSKVIKGQIVQDLRHTLITIDQKARPEAQKALEHAGEALGDLTSNIHVKQHVVGQGELAKGYGVFSAQQRSAYLDALPFQEFYRAEHRVEWRDWPTRWKEQGGRFFPGPSDYPAGRMIHEVNSSIWLNLAGYSDGTGTPYPPFAWNSGMSVRPVSVAEAAKLGLYGRHRTKQTPKQLDFNAGITFDASFDDDIKSALLDGMADWAEEQGEIVHEEA